MPALQCTVVTPETTVYDESASFVALTLFDGEIGIAPGRMPLIGRLGFGEMRINRPGGTDRYYIEGGFVEVIGNVVTLLTQRAVPAAELDEAVLAEQLETARTQTANTEQLISSRDAAVTKTRAQLRVARRV